MFLKMSSFILFYTLLAILSKVTGVIVNTNSGKPYTHCKGNNEPIQLTNPFNQLSGDLSVSNTNEFVQLVWNRKKPGENEQKLIEIFEGKVTETTLKIKSYNVWGLQINNAAPEDTATYFITWSSTTYNTIKANISITIATYPVLQSDKLTTDEQSNADGSKIYRCGQIASLGNPPVNILWKAANGTIITSTFQDGYQTVSVPAGKDIGKLSCEIDSNSPGYQCIPPADIPKWEGTQIGQVESASSNLLIYIIAACVGFVALVAVIIVIVLICKKRKGGEKYNAKKEAAKVEAGQGDTNSPLVKDKVDSTYDKTYQDKRTPIYKGPNTDSPATRHSYPRFQPAAQEDYEEYELNGKGRTPKNASPPPIAPKYRKKSEPIIDSRGNEVRPPEKKPRSIFLTPSMEELDKINEAVRGGRGSEPPGTCV